jgi:hypothetical protein
MATVLAVASQNDCVDTFYTLYNASSTMADANEYAKAAALREASAKLFQDCLDRRAAPKAGIYPFDGVGAYLIAATFWHLANENFEAQRDLGLAEMALQDVLIKYSASTLTDPQRMYLYEVKRLIQDDESGRWAVWKDQ